MNKTIFMTFLTLTLIFTNLFAKANNFLEVDVIAIPGQDPEPNKAAKVVYIKSLDKDILIKKITANNGNCTVARENIFFVQSECLGDYEINCYKDSYRIVNSQADLELIPSQYSYQNHNIAYDNNRLDLDNILYYDEKNPDYGFGRFKFFIGFKDFNLTQGHQNIVFYILDKVNYGLVEEINEYGAKYQYTTKNSCLNIDNFTIFTNKGNFTYENDVW